MRRRFSKVFAIRSALGLMLLLAFVVSNVTVAADLSGKYDGSKLSLELKAETDGAYSGTIHMGDKHFPLKGKLVADKLEGTFSSDGNDFPFSASVEGADLKLATGGTTIALKRQQPPATNPLLNVPANPLLTGGNDTVVGDMREYRHVSRRFTIRYPQNWSMIRDLDEGNINYCFTPETGKTKADDLDIQVSFSLSEVDPSSPGAGKDSVAMLKHVLPMLRTIEPDVEVVGEVTPAMLGKLQAARVSFKGRPKRKKSGTFAGELFLAQDHDVLYEASTLAPEGQYSAQKDAMLKVIAQSEFGFAAPSQRGPAKEASDIVAKYTESVVCIMAQDDRGSSSGTGFIIQKHGYVATNAHVAVDLTTGKPHKKYTARWDLGSHHKDMPLTLVAFLFQPNVLSHHHAKDVALFKLPAGDYPTVPLTPQTDVNLGDEIVTMGFPKTFDFGTLNIFTTKGVVTRFNRALDGKVDTMFIDAKITHGNSGGPCFSRVTGGAIGLNTYGSDIKSSGDNDLVGYNGIVPVEVLREVFPVEAELGLDMDTDPLDFYDCYSLAHLYGGLGRYTGATRLAKKAIELQGTNADAHALLGQILLMSAKDRDEVAAAVSALNRALECQENHATALLFLSRLYAMTNDLVKATQYADRAVKAHPDNVWAHYQQAQIYQTLKRYQEATTCITKAKELAREVLAEPYVLSGQVLYDQGKFDEGKAEFEKASRIHPTNVEARLGVGKSYELKQDYQSALVEYGRVEADLSENPFVLSAMGRCYNLLKRYDDALEQYGHAISRCQLTGQTPEVEAFLTSGKIYSEVKHEPERALPAYINGLMYYGGKPAGAELYLRVAKIFQQDVNRPGIAYSALCNALFLDSENQDVRRELQNNRHPMSLDDMTVMVTKLRFPLALVASMVRNTPLDFTKTAEELNKMIDDGFPSSLAQAIFDSNKRFGEKTAANTGQNANQNANANQNNGRNTPQRGGDASHPAAMIGTWVARIQGQRGNAVLRMELAGNGQYSIETQSDTAGAGQDRGTWAVVRSQLMLRGASGRTEANNFRLDGDAMSIEVQGVGTLNFERQ
jgi:tetratricopeptide (TPR) repeat protein/S1-C subfamily serine protease